MSSPGVWPTIRAHDAPGLLAFLCEVVGFCEQLVVTDGQRVTHAELRWPEGGGVMLGSVRDNPDDQWPIAPGSAGIYLSTQDIDGLVGRLRDADAVITSAPAETDYGSTGLNFLDPEGNRWSAGTYTGAP